jgi:urease accessory protein
LTAIEKLHEQRSLGHVKLHMGCDGPLVIREAGAAKLRLPRGSREAILINVGGGLAGGDNFGFEISSAENAHLTVTTQAAERVYRSLGPAAKIATTLALEKGSTLRWLPNEMILYDGSNLCRTYEIHMAAQAKFLSIEPLIFGRTETREIINTVALHDSWRIHRQGQLIHADEFAVGPHLPKSKATLGEALAIATLIYVAEDAEAYLEAVRGRCDEFSGATAWNGKLIARITAKDGFALRKAVIPLLSVFAEQSTLPKNWTM